MIGQWREETRDGASNGTAESLLTVTDAPEERVAHGERATSADKLC